MDIETVRNTLTGMRRLQMIPGPYVFSCSCGTCFPVNDDEDTVERIHEHVTKHYGRSGVTR